MNTFRRCALAALAPALALLHIPVHAIAPDDAASRAAQPSLQIIADALEVEPSLIDTRTDAGLAGRSTDFSLRNGGTWEIRWDTRGHRAAVVQGSGVPLIPGQGNSLDQRAAVLSGDVQRDLPVVAEAARQFIDSVPELLAADSLELALDHERSTAYGLANERWFLEFRQHHQGIPVDGAFVYVRIVHGNVVQFGTERVGDVQVSLPKGMSTDREAIFADAWQALGFPAGTVVHTWLEPGELRLYPALPAGQSPGEAHGGLRGLGYNHIPAWRYVFRVDDHATWQVLVDANSHAVIDVRDLTVHADATVSGGIYPNTNTDAQVVVPFPYTAVTNNGNKVTDLDGVYDYTGGNASTSLNGKYFRMVDTCGSISLSDGNDGNLELGTSGGTDCATPGVGGPGNTHASRTGFYHLTLINAKARSILPGNTWLQGKVTANMNIVNTCNANWDGTSVNFFRSGNGCSNTGEIAAVFLHEWGHGLDTNTGGTPANDKASGEAVGDTFAFLETRDSCIGPNFRPGTPCYNCTDCTGVRDLGVFALGGPRTIASPATITANNGLNCDRFSCPYTNNQGFPYRGPMGYQGHCESHIASTANWDLKNALVSEFGENGWQRMDDLWYGSLVPSKSAYRVASGGQCNAAATVDGCGGTNWYTVYLAVDDDDGNLANGTPNACRIWDAFNTHGIACGSRPVCTESGPAGFSLQVQPASQSICAGEVANYDIDIVGNAGFNAPVSLSLDGAPAGAIGSFQPNPALPGNGAGLQITGTASLAAGEYAMSVEGTSGDDSVSADFVLDVESAAAQPPALTAPQNGASHVGAQPLLEWTAVPGASSYSVEVATDAAFDEIVASTSGLNGTSWQVTGLVAGTTYYWRVRADNGCGSSAASPVFAFTVAVTYCRAPGTGIPDNQPSGVTDTLSVASSATISSLKLVVRGAHTYVGDLSFTLSHDGTSVPVIVRPGHPEYEFGCGGDNIDVVLDDASVLPVDEQCSNTPPALSGVLKPEQSLAAFAGHDFGGDWTLKAVDSSAPDAGTLIEWCLEPELDEPDLYQVGGTVSGLVGTGLTLRLNGGMPLPIAANAAFVFPAGLPDDSAYAVAIGTQPTNPNQVCVVSNGEGSIDGADVGNVGIACTTMNYSVGGQVAGLLGSGLTLRLNGGAPLPVDGNGAFVFPSELPDASVYAVTIAAQPTDPNQICTVDHGEGTIDGGDITDIAIQCAAHSYTVGGHVTGLLGSGLTLRLNDGTPLAIASNGFFEFPDPVADGTAFTVFVVAPPVDPVQTCDVDNGDGHVKGTDVTDIQVRCSDRIFHSTFE